MTTTIAVKAPSTADMAKALKAEDAGEAAPDAGESQAPTKGAEADDAGARTASPDDQGKVEVEEVEGQSDDVDGDDKDEDQADKPGEEASKPTRRQRQRLRAEKAEKLAEERGAQASEAVGFANTFRAERNHFKALYEDLLATAKEQYGYEPDANATQLAEARLKLSHRDAQDQIADFKKKEAMRSEIVQAKDDAKLEVSTEIDRLTKKYPALTPRKLARAFVTALDTLEQGEPEPTMEDVARSLLPIASLSKNKAKHDAARAQHTVNKETVKPIQGKGGSARRDLTPTTENIAALLRSEG